MEVNRQFDSFDELVEDDARWAYRFQREYNKKMKDPNDLYLEIKDSEERRKKKGLPPRLVILPGWDMSDAGRYDEEQKRKRHQNQGQKTSSRRSDRSKPSPHVTNASRTKVTPTAERDANNGERKSRAEQTTRSSYTARRYPSLQGKVVDYVSH